MHKATNRPQRVAELLKRELAVLIPRTVRDPHVGLITITHADISRDFANARIYFTMLGDEAKIKQTERALNNAAGFLRHELHGRVVLRTIPRLRFVYDSSVERGARLTTLINRATAEDQAAAKPKADETEEE
jgi:ribosome-binding factor A